MLEQEGGKQQVRQLVVAGSIRHREERVVLDAWQALTRTPPPPLLVLAPRHLERVETVVAEIEVTTEEVEATKTELDGIGR